MSTTTLLRLPDLQGQSFDVYFRYDEFGADTHSPPHPRLGPAQLCSPWRDAAGDRRPALPLASAIRGMDTTGAGAQLLQQPGHRLPLAVPLRRAVTTPAGDTLHPGDQRDPQGDPLGLRRARVNLPTSAQDLRLARVVMDQLECAQPHDDYLPYGRTPALREVLDALQAEPGDNRSLAQWAQQVHSTERTLARHCQRELGMTFGEWRQRLRFLAAIEALEAGRGSSRSPSTSATAAPRRSSRCSAGWPAPRRNNTAWPAAPRTCRCCNPPCMRCGYARSSRHPEFACQPPAAIPTLPSRCSSPFSSWAAAPSRPIGWLSESSYADLVALCQFLPGPASSQVGMALGLARAGYPAPSPPGSVSPCPRRCCWYSSLSAWDAGARCCPRACCMA